MLFIFHQVSFIKIIKEKLVNFCFVFPELTFPMDNNSKVFQQPYKKPIDFYDDDLSDDEDNDVVFMPQQHPPTTRKTLPNINAINKMKGYSVPSFKTKMKPIPSLISTAGRVNNNPNNYSRGDLMLSQVPGLTPIDRSKFFSFDKFRPKQGKREAFNGTGHRIGTASSSFGSRVSGFSFYFISCLFVHQTPCQVLSGRFS